MCTYTLSDLILLQEREQYEYACQQRWMTMRLHCVDSCIVVRLHFFADLPTSPVWPKIRVCKWLNDIYANKIAWPLDAGPRKSTLGPRKGFPCAARGQATRRRCIIVARRLGVSFLDSITMVNGLLR